MPALEGPSLFKPVQDKVSGEDVGGGKKLGKMIDDAVLASLIPALKQIEERKKVKGAKARSASGKDKEKKSAFTLGSAMMIK